MKVRLTFVVDLENGEYTAEFRNLTSPGNDIPLGPLRHALEQALDRAARGEAEPIEPREEEAAELEPAAYDVALN
jgi:hypothetical protein